MTFHLYANIHYASIKEHMVIPKLIWLQKNDKQNYISKNDRVGSSQGISLQRNIEKESINCQNQLHQNSGEKNPSFTATKQILNQEKGNSKIVGNLCGTSTWPCPSSVVAWKTAASDRSVGSWSLVQKEWAFLENNLRQLNDHEMPGARDWDWGID